MGIGDVADVRERGHEVGKLRARDAQGVACAALGGIAAGAVVVVAAVDGAGLDKAALLLDHRLKRRHALVKLRGLHGGVAGVDDLLGHIRGLGLRAGGGSSGGIRRGGIHRGEARLLVGHVVGDRLRRHRGRRGAHHAVILFCGGGAVADSAAGAEGQAHYKTEHEHEGAFQIHGRDLHII